MNTNITKVKTEAMLNAKAKSELKEVGFFFVLGRLWCTSIADTPFCKNYIKLIPLQSLS